jgi:hypothetical protein
MPYTLIMKSGQQMKFYVESVAKMYQTIYGGVLLTDNGRPLLKLVDRLAA